MRPREPRRQFTEQHRRVQRYDQRRMARRDAAGGELNLLQKYRTGWHRVKWKPRRLTAAHEATALELVQRFVPIDRQEQRRRDFIRAFLESNGNHRMEDMILLLVGQMKSDGLAPGTVNNYLRTAKIMFKHDWGPNCCRAMKAVRLWQTEVDLIHAPDRSPEECLAVISDLYGVCPLSANICEMILRAGLRAADIARVRRCDVQLLPNELQVRVRRAKNVTAVQDQVIARVPLWFGELSEHLKAALRYTTIAEGRVQPWKHITAQRVLRALRRVDTAVTSYTFRRCMFHRALQACNFDATMCAERYSLHKQKRMLKAHYDALGLHQESATNY